MFRLKRLNLQAFLHICYLALCLVSVALFHWGWATAEPQLRHEIYLYPVALMAWISFPISVLSAAFYDPFIGTGLTEPWGYTLLFWLPTCLLGYIQWFILLPKLWRALRLRI